MITTTLQIEDLQKWYPTKLKKNKSIFYEKKLIKAVDGINLTIEKGEIIGVIGESGCGKSTLAKLLVLLEKPSSGRVLINGEDTIDLEKKDSLAFRRKVQMIFQNPFDTFDPREKVFSLLEKTLKIHKIGKDKEERKNMIINALNEVGLSPGERFINRFPHELSGGQLQRISIVKSMLLEPEILIADESVSMLDVSVRAEIINLLINLVKEKNTTLIFISHDLNTTSYLCDRLAVMYLGRVVEVSDTIDLIKNPSHPYTKALLSNTSNLQIDNQLARIKLEGEPPTPIDNGPGCYFAPRCFMASKECHVDYPEYVRINDHHLVACINTKKENKV